MSERERLGFFEAPAEPPAERRLHIDPAWSPARVSGEIIRGEWPLLLAGSSLLICYNIAVMLVPVVVGRLVETVIAPLTRGTPLPDLLPLIVWWAAAVIALYVVINLGYRFGGRIGWLAVQRSQFEVAQAVLERVLDERGMAGPSRAQGGVLSVATADAHRSCLVLYVTIYPPGQIVGLLVASIVLVTVNPWLGIGVIIGLPIVLAIMHLLTKPLRRRSQTERAKLANAAASAADLIAGYRVIRGLHAQDTAAARYRDVSRRALGSTIAARRAKATFDGIGIGVAQLFAVGVVVAAAVLAFNGAIGAGQLATVAGVAVTIVQPLNSLVNTLGSYWAIAQASTRRVLDLIGTGPNPASLGEAGFAPRATEEDEPALEFRALALADGVTLTASIERGAFVVVDLPQSAHAQLADRLALRAPVGDDPRALLVGGEPIGALRPGVVRERVLVAPHTPGILSGTVLDNVRATGRDTRSDERAREALRVASLAPSELPDGDATDVGDDGWELSGGQRQRVALARAVAADPEVLVLVEPTTSVDAVTEQRIAAGLHDDRAGRTTVVVTSSPAFRAVADRLVRASEGGAEASAGAETPATARPTPAEVSTDE